MPNTIDSSLLAIHTKPNLPIVSIIAGLFLFFLSGCSSSPQQHWGMSPTPHQWSSRVDSQASQHEPEFTATSNTPSLSAEEHEHLGDGHLQQGNLPLAAISYQKALSLNPSSVDLPLKLGMIFVQKGLGEEAQPFLRQALDINPQSAKAAEAMGQCFLLLKQEEQAEQYFRQALGLDSQLWQPHAFLGILYDHRGDYWDAIREYELALALNPNNPEIYNNLGVSHYLNGQHEYAINALEAAINTGHTDLQVFNNLGLAYAKLGEYQEALSAFRQGSDSATALNNVGVAFLADGNPHQAISCFEQALDSSPRYYQTAHQNLRKARQALIREPSHSDIMNTVVGPVCSTMF